jgi:nucleoid-associated protein YgaU
MFAQRWTAALVLMMVVAVAMLGWARPSGGAGEGIRYVVKPGDTLWVIAEEHYGGDPREAIWAIKERNGLRTSTISPGAVLVLPP